jgi:hypothetical protein
MHMLCPQRAYYNIVKGFFNRYFHICGTGKTAYRKIPGFGAEHIGIFPINLQRIIFA